MLTELVSAVVMSIVAEALAAGVVERHAVDLDPASAPLSIVSGVNSPESSAAAAVTTFIVEPGW